MSLTPQELSRAHRLARRLAQRATPRIDVLAAPGERNAHGVDFILLSRDAANGAVTFALRTPPHFVYPEKQHFYDCEQELFQLEGDFRHDRLRPYAAGDYVYRPAGTVYGDDEGSDEGGVIVASLARELTRFHFDDHPKPWRGHYLVDRAWRTRLEQPLVIQTRELPWQPSGIAEGVDMRVLRGRPGMLRWEDDALFAHSPWAADFAVMLRFPAGWRGELPAWRGFYPETLAIAGRATIGGEPWYRGCYQFGGPAGPCAVESETVLYLRAFRADAPDALTR